MTPTEFWRLHEMKRPKDPAVDYAGGLTQEDVEAMWEMLNE